MRKMEFIRGYEVDRHGYIKREIPIPKPIPYCGHGYGFLSLEDGIYEICKGVESAFIISKSCDRREAHGHSSVG